MKTRILIGMALLMLISATALAADNVITINGGRNTVAMRPTQPVSNHKIAQPASVFYNNIGSGYVSNDGWTISDGSPIGTEYTLANQIASLKTGTTKKLSMGIGYVEGTNSTIIILDKDCKNAPCGTIDKTNLCKGTAKNMPNFGSTGTTVVSIKCKAKLTKKKLYWVYPQSPANTWLAWNLSASGLGGLIEYTNDAPGPYYSGQPVGALEIQ